MSRRILLVVAALVLVGGWWWWSGRQTDAIAVDIVTVGRVETLRAYVTASGEIVATRYADLGSSVMGRLVSLRVREGDRVTAGQVLARIDPVQAQSAVASSAAALRALEAEAEGSGTQVRAAQAEVAVATSRQTEAQRALERARDLFKSGLVAQSEFEAAAAAADTANAQVNAAKAALATAEQARSASSQRVAQGRADGARVQDQLAKTEITAPIAGVITRLDVEEGEMVVMGVQNQPGSILMTISDLSAINAEVKVAEADVLRLAAGNAATVTLDALPGRSYTGQVAEVGASALPQIGTQASAREFRVKVRLEGDVALLRPGLTCDTEILVAERRNVLAVPLQAVVQRDGKSGVFVIKDRRAIFTPVTTGIIGGLTIEVTGVDEGASIVAGPFQLLRDLADGAAVRPIAPATSSPAK
ncbi:MAG: efflux RND transporter periplasmic adaptor subunit [Acidobacteria bacterium]|jgi:HlyD family secretion protein|nr:efflux RND transporter periplasmic adaptor subunit [Acidobacteriota bacterium]